MTKAELLAALADASDDAEVYVDDGYGILRSRVTVEIDGDQIAIGFEDVEEDEIEDE